MEPNVPHIFLADLRHRCHVDESVIPQDFTDRLSPTKSALFAALCPRLRVAVAKMNILICEACKGRSVKEMRNNIAVEELHTILPLVQSGLAEALGVSTWKLSTAAKYIVNMKRWPSCAYAAPANVAAALDANLVGEITGGDQNEVALAADELAEYVQKHSGLHLCAGVERFRVADEASRGIIKGGDDKNNNR